MKQFIKGVLISTIGAFLFLSLFFFASLQTSYRYCPPTAAERSEHPVLIRFLYGGE